MQRAQADGAKLLATFITEESPNNFPPLPVRPEAARRGEAGP